MLRRFFPYLLLSGLCIGATCERTVDLDIEQPPPSLVVNSSFTLGEFVKVAVSKSQSIFDNSLPEYLGDAIVTLYQEDQFIEQLELYVDPAPRIPPYYISTSFKPETAITYTIRVEAIGFETVVAHSFIPEPVAFTALQVSELEESEGASSYSRLFSYQINLDFDDPIGEENYYHLNIFQEILNVSYVDGDTIILGRELQRVDLIHDDPKIVRDILIGGLLLKNKPKAGGFSFEVEVEIVPEFEALGKIYAELRTVTKEYYLYFTTFNRQQNQSDGPFNDPIIIFDNVENGQGYFAGYNTTQDSVSLSI